MHALGRPVCSAADPCRWRALSLPLKRRICCTLTELTMSTSLVSKPINGLWPRFHLLSPAVLEMHEQNKPMAGMNTCGVCMPAAALPSPINQPSSPAAAHLAPTENGFDGQLKAKVALLKAAPVLADSLTRTAVRPLAYAGTTTRLAFNSILVRA